MADHWHTYWKNPGDSGLPTRIQWVLPEGWKAGEIQWPYPKPLPIGPLMNYGYEDEVLLLTDLTAARVRPAGRLPGQGAAPSGWCARTCAFPRRASSTWCSRWRRARAARTRVSRRTSSARATRYRSTRRGWKFESALRGGKPGACAWRRPPAPQHAAAIAFFPDREQLIEPAAPQKLTREGNAVVIEMKLADPPPTGLHIGQRAWRSATAAGRESRARRSR